MYPQRCSFAHYVIRPYTPADALALQDATNRSYEHLKTFMPWAVPNQSIDEALDLCRRFDFNYKNGIDFTMGIFDGHRVAGGTGYHLRHGPLESGTLEIGMWIASDYAGRGLGTKSLVALTEWAFQDWSQRKLIWRCDTRNYASMRVAEKASYVLARTEDSESPINGEIRQLHVYERVHPAYESSVD